MMVYLKPWSSGEYLLNLTAVEKAAKFHAADEAEFEEQTIDGASRKVYVKLIIAVQKTLRKRLAKDGTTVCGLDIYADAELEQLLGGIEMDMEADSRAPAVDGLVDRAVAMVRELAEHHIAMKTNTDMLRTEHFTIAAEHTNRHGTVISTKGIIEADAARFEAGELHRLDAEGRLTPAWEAVTAEIQNAQRYGAECITVQAHHCVVALNDDHHEVMLRAMPCNVNLKGMPIDTAVEAVMAIAQDGLERIGFDADDFIRQLRDE